MIALSVAATLAIFVVYTALAGNGVAQLTPSTVVGAKGHVSLVGKVVGRVELIHDGRRFWVQDIAGHRPDRVLVEYHGTVPDLFRSGRDIVVDGTMGRDVFAATRNSLVTKCPDHYAPKKSLSA